MLNSSCWSENQSYADLCVEKNVLKVFSQEYFNSILFTNNMWSDDSSSNFVFEEGHEESLLFGQEIE